MCNFKYVSKTLAFKHQVQQMYHYKHNLIISKKISVNNAYLVSVGSLKKPDVLLSHLRLALENDISLTTTIYLSHSVDVYSKVYTAGSILPLRTDHRKEPLFGEVVHIL
ncbi:hypothetical protein AMECASPLE_036696, partial [Ameca splendens]